MTRELIYEMTENMLIDLTLKFGGDDERVLNFCVLIDTIDDFNLIDSTFRQLITS